MALKWLNEVFYSPFIIFSLNQLPREIANSSAKAIYWVSTRALFFFSLSIG